MRALVMDFNGDREVENIGNQWMVRTREAITRAIDGLSNGLSGDLLDQDIRECLHWLGEITGEITTDNILGEIFAHFCVGK